MWLIKTARLLCGHGLPGLVGKFLRTELLWWNAAGLRTFADRNDTTYGMSWTMGYRSRLTSRQVQVKDSSVEEKKEICKMNCWFAVAVKLRICFYVQCLLWRGLGCRALSMYAHCALSRCFCSSCLRCRRDCLISSARRCCRCLPEAASTCCRSYRASSASKTNRKPLQLSLHVSIQLNLSRLRKHSLFLRKQRPTSEALVEKILLGFCLF